MTPQWSFATLLWAVFVLLLLLLLTAKESSSFVPLTNHHHHHDHQHRHGTAARHSHYDCRYALASTTRLPRISSVSSVSSALFYNKANGREDNEDEQQQQQQQQQQQPQAHASSSRSIAADDDEDATERNRMFLVRKLQQLYYRDETSGVDHDHFGVYDNMPILRSTRVELPGFQSLWNITDPLEIHMFLKVWCSSSSSHSDADNNDNYYNKPQRQNHDKKYFGHLHMAKELQGFTSSSSSSSPSSSMTYHVGGAAAAAAEGDEEKNQVSAEEAFRLQLKKQQECDYYSRDRYKIGTLMQVSDCHQDARTGHLMVLVQALARFTIVPGSMEQWNWLKADHSNNNMPYSKQEMILRSRQLHRKPTVQRASVELLPDEELVQHFTQKAKETSDAFDFSLNHDIPGAACAGAVAEASEWRFFECSPQKIPPILGGALAPVASMRSCPILHARKVHKKVKATMEEYLSQPPMELHPGECSLYFSGSRHDTNNNDDDGKDGTNHSNDSQAAAAASQQHVLEVERSVWLELDKLVKNLRHLNPRSNTQIPIPNQVLSLIPPIGWDNWPEDFGLALYVRQLVRAHGVLARNKYKFSNGFQLVPKDYPPLRRARRLSYILWNVFLEQDTMDVPSGEMQRVLEVNSIASRLEAGLLQLQTINRILQTLIAD